MNVIAQIPESEWTSEQKAKAARFESSAVHSVIGLFRESWAWPRLGQSWPRSIFPAVELRRRCS